MLEDDDDDEPLQTQEEQNKIGKLIFLGPFMASFTSFVSSLSAVPILQSLFFEKEPSSIFYDLIPEIVE